VNAHASWIRLAGAITSLVVAGHAAPLSDEEAAQVAIEAVVRAGGAGQGVVSQRQGARGPTFLVDERWSVAIVRDTGQVRRLSDHGFEGTPHVEHVLPDPPPTSAEIEQAARELIEKVFPGFDMSEFVLHSAGPRREQARVEAIWRRVIPENGFPGPGGCNADFCWPDRAIYRIGAYYIPVPDEWRRPPAVSTEEAEELTRGELGDLRGGWLRTEKGFYMSDHADPSTYRPAWEVQVWLGPRERPDECVPDRGVFVDPWTGEVRQVVEYGAAAPPGYGPGPRGDAGVSLVMRDRGLIWGGVAALGVVLGVTLCLTRRRKPR